MENNVEPYGKKPQVSVISPIYNTPPLCLQRSADSVLGQTFEDFEYILVDDGSKPECSLLCDGIAERDARISVVHQGNRGFAGAMNTGIAAAHGECLMFLDPDDELMPFAVEHAVEYMVRYECDMVCATWIRRFPGEDIVGRFELGGEPAKLLDEGELLGFRVFALTGMFPRPKPESLNMDIGQGHVPKLFKKKLFSAIELDEEAPWASDTIMIADVLAKCEKVLLVNEVWYIYYMNEFSGTNSITFGVDARERKAMKKRSDLYTEDIYYAARFFRSAAPIACAARTRGFAAVPDIVEYLREPEIGEVYDRFEAENYTISRNQEIMVFCFRHRLLHLLALMCVLRVKLNKFKRKGLFSR